MKKSLKIFGTLASIATIIGIGSISYFYTATRPEAKYIIEKQDFSQYSNYIQHFSDKQIYEFKHKNVEYKESFINSIVSKWTKDQFQLELSYNLSWRLTNFNNERPNLYNNKLTVLTDNDFNRNSKASLLNISINPQNDTYNFDVILSTSSKDRSTFLADTTEEAKYFISNKVWTTKDAKIRIPEQTTNIIDGIAFEPCQYCFFTGWTGNGNEMNSMFYTNYYQQGGIYDPYHQTPGSGETGEIDHSYILQELFN